MDKSTKKTLRVGIFDEFERADYSVRALLDAGFDKEEITVICPRRLEKQFKEFTHQKFSGKKNFVAGVTGAAIGAVLGGLAAVAAATMGGMELFTAGSLLTGTGAIVGGFIGLMMRQGVEKELAYYYDQAISRGRILVAADVEDKSLEKTKAAEQILSEPGVKAVKLEEG